MVVEYRADIIKLMIKKLFALFLLSFITLVAAAAPVMAAPRGGASQPTYGIDISYPQCGRKVPTDQAFGIVGVNGGNAATTNPCLADQLRWANKSSGIVAAQPKLQLYVNTANPGQVKDQMTSKWPDANTAPVTNPYGLCAGSNDQACSWQYGWDKGVYATDYFTTQAAVAGLNSVNPSTYRWWLDVETMNTWQTGSSEAYANNAAALEGWADYFKYIQAEIGLYSTAVQWKEIVGSSVSSTSSLNGLINWRPGGASLSTAKQACMAAPLTTGGKVILTQYVSKNLDYNYSCI
jgi:hypothetical protein